MRDVHALKWAEASRRVLFENDEPALDAAYSVLLDARVELQRATGARHQRADVAGPADGREGAR